MNGLRLNLGKGGYRGRMVSVLPALLFLFFGCATIAVWLKWSPEEQKRYFGLTFIEGDSLLAEYRALPDQERRDSWYQAYWSARDSSGSQLARHLQLLDRAWDQFGGRMFFRDDRSRILVKYGPPENQVQNQPYLHATKDDRLAGGTYVKEKAWAVWEYPSQGRYYDFLQDDGRYLVAAATYSDKLHPLAYFGAQPKVLFPGPGGQAGRKELDCHYARFRSADSAKVRWEIYWQVPVPESRDSGSGREYSGTFRILREGVPLRTDSVSYRLRYTGPRLLADQAYGQRNYDLPPGRYRMEIEIYDVSGDTLYAGRAEAELVGYRSGIREVSDPEMAVLQDSSYIGEEFQKGSFRRVIPSALNAVYRYQPFYVYYEAYNLQTDRFGEHQVSISHSIYLSDTAGTLKECIVDTRDIFYQERGDCLKACHKVHPMAMEPGDYILVVGIRDLIAGRTSNLAIPFRIEGSQQGSGRLSDWQKSTDVPALRPPRKTPRL